MITNQVIQSSIEELKEITKVDLSVYDLRGGAVASTLEECGLDGKFLKDFAVSPADSQKIDRYHLLKIMDDGEPRYLLVAQGISSDAYAVGRIAVSQLQHLIAAYKERVDRKSFFQNLLLDNLLLVDIYNRAKRLRVETSLPKVVFVVETPPEESGIVEEVLQGIYSEQGGDYVTAVDEGSVILIKTLEEEVRPEQLVEMAQTIVDMMNGEAMVNVTVAYGAPAGELKDVSRSYKEAKMALEVGKIFYQEKKVVAYGNLGIGRLIYQLPINLCRIFVKEIFPNGLPEELDEEMLATIHKFFENNLNISETSRQLFLHRNTLMYRLEKLQKSTGLDLRSFEDALTFEIALMVVKYMEYLENRDKGSRNI